MVQSGARRRGNPGTNGNDGNVISVSYRIYRRLSGSNPTLSAISLTFGSFDDGSAGLQSRRTGLRPLRAVANPTLSAITNN